MSKRYKEIKVKYTIEDTAEKRDMQEDAAKLQKLANAITSGDDQGALKLFEDELHRQETMEERAMVRRDIYETRIKINELVRDLTD